MNDAQISQLKVLFGFENAQEVVVVPLSMPVRIYFKTTPAARGRVRTTLVSSAAFDLPLEFYSEEQIARKINLAAHNAKVEAEFEEWINSSKLAKRFENRKEQWSFFRNEFAL